MMILGALALAATVATPHVARSTPAAIATDTLRVVLVVDDTTARRSLVHGAVLGAEEAAHTGALFGTAVALRVVTRATFDSIARATGPAPARATAASLFVAAGDTATCSDVVLQSARLTIPVLDAGCAFVDSAVVRTVYSLVGVGDPSATASASATPASTAGDSTRVELWHWTLERFGGEQLNERYRRRFGARMDSPAWVGWFSMKIALDLALHARSVRAPALLKQLADPRAQFDGQKGRPLRFAADTHRLIQPRYRVAGSGDAERVVAEVVP